MKKTRTITGWPAVFLCLVPMGVGYVMIVKWIIEGAFS